MSEKILVFLPTYNERENVQNIFTQLNVLGLNLDILFLDDNSPDGTGKLLDEMATRHSNLHVIHRSGKLGIGSAHREGIRWAYARGYKTLVTMDCDFTHSPEYVHQMLARSVDHDVVVGSRYLVKKSLADWNLYRKVMTLLGHVLTRYLLGVQYDATGAFRVYRLDRIPSRVFDLVSSQGYAFFFESLYTLCRNRFTVAEVGILLPSRTYGTSKMTYHEVIRSVRTLLSVYRTNLLDPQRYLMAGEPAQVDATLVDPQGWDDYWNKKSKPSHGVYDLIAVFYRKFIIRPLLNHFFKKSFKAGQSILHAGCGSGQVDTDLSQRFSITALDISAPALAHYAKFNGRFSRVLHGSIFKIPSGDATYDGIYNLGVMEHFTPSEIGSILAEFKRVLKPGGKLLLFWPPVFGTSVLFLDSVHFVLNRILKKNIQLHPDEITRVRSRAQIRQLLADAGFAMDGFYFGPRDFFTYAVIAAHAAPELSLGTVRERESVQTKAGRPERDRSSPAVEAVSHV